MRHARVWMVGLAVVGVAGAAVLLVACGGEREPQRYSDAHLYWADTLTHRLVAGDSAAQARAVDVLQPIVTDADGAVRCADERAAWGRRQATYADRVTAGLCARLGHVLRKQGRNDEALVVLGEAVRFGHLMDLPVAVQVLTGTGTVAEATGDVERAVKYQDDAERLARVLGRNDLAAQAAECRARLLRRTKQRVPVQEDLGHGRVTGAAGGLSVVGVLAYLLWTRGRKKGE